MRKYVLDYHLFRIFVKNIFDLGIEVAQTRIVFLEERFPLQNNQECGLTHLHALWTLTYRTGYEKLFEFLCN